MSDTERNEGIVVTGGSFQATSVAVGRNAQSIVGSATATLTARGDADLAAKLDALLSAVQDNARELGDPDQALALTGRVAEELGRDSPDVPTVRGFLDRLAGLAGPVTTIATAAAAVAALL
jgi:hypothetical protein